MAVLLLAEVTDGELGLDATAKAVTALKPLGDVTVLCAGASASAAAQTAAGIEGVAKVLCAEDPLLGHRLAEPTAALIVSLAGDYSHIAAPATTDAKNIMPRVAALLDVMILTDVSAIVDADTFERPIYAGNALQTVKTADATKVFTIRTSGFDAAGEGGSAEVEAIGAGEDPALSEWVEDKVAASDRPELTSAGIVVSGGRALGSKEEFAMIEKLADKLGAAVGASRAAVDFGLRSERLAGGPDRQGGGARPLHRRRHLGRDPAPRRHEGQQGHRRHQQGRGRANLSGRRLRAGGRSLHRRAGADGEAALGAALPLPGGPGTSKVRSYDPGPRPYEAYEIRPFRGFCARRGSYGFGARWYEPYHLAPFPAPA